MIAAATTVVINPGAARGIVAALRRWAWRA
jgi:hypothetical protein